MLVLHSKELSMEQHARKALARSCIFYSFSIRHIERALQSVEYVLLSILGILYSTVSSLLEYRWGGIDLIPISGTSAFASVVFW